MAGLYVVGRVPLQPGGRGRRRAGIGRLPGIARRVVELEAERLDERRVVEQRLTGLADEVRRDAAAGEELLEVDRRALDRRVPTAGPLDLGDLEAATLGGLGDRLGLEDVRIEGRGPAGERLAHAMERVVGRAMDGRPRARRQRVPAGAGVGRRLGPQAVVRGGRPVLQEAAHRGHQAVLGVLGDEILAKPIGREEHGLGDLAWRRGLGGRDGGGGQADQQHGRRTDRQQAGTETGHDASSPVEGTTGTSAMAVRSDHPGLHRTAPDRGAPHDIAM